MTHFIENIFYALVSSLFDLSDHWQAWDIIVQQFMNIWEMIDATESEQASQASCFIL
jgi:hypothetical protein